MDDLSAFVEEREAQSPGFKALVEAAERRREVARQLSKIRQEKKLSQTWVAARMESSQSVVSRIENGGDVMLSTLEKYVAAVGVALDVKIDRHS